MVDTGRTGRTLRRDLLLLAAWVDRAAVEARNRSWLLPAAVLAASTASVLILLQSEVSGAMRAVMVANLLTAAHSATRLAIRHLPDGIAVRAALPRVADGERTGTGVVVEAARIARCDIADEETSRSLYWPRSIFGAAQQQPDRSVVKDAAENLLQRLERQGLDVDDILIRTIHLTGDHKTAVWHCCLAHQAGRLDIPVATIMRIDTSTLEALGRAARRSDRSIEGAASLTDGGSLHGLLQILAGCPKKQKVARRLAENWHQSLEELQEATEELTQA